MGLFRTHDACKAALKQKTKDPFLYIVNEGKNVVLVASHGGIAKYFMLGRVQSVDQHTLYEAIDFIQDGTLNHRTKQWQKFCDYD